MAEITLDQVLSAPMDQEALQRHMQAIGALPAPALPPAPAKVPVPAQPVSANPTVPPMAGPLLAGADNHPHAPKVQPMPEAINPGNDPEGITSTAPIFSTPERGPVLNFKQRQSLPIGSVGTSDYDRGVAARIADQNANHWGTAENHPGVIGKVGHVLAKIGNIAGTVVAPSTMSLIGGTDLNRRGQYNEALRRAGQERTQETAEEAVRQRPEIAEEVGELRGRNQAEHDKVLRDIAAGHDTSGETKAETAAGGRTGAAQIAADARVETGAAHNASQEKIAGLGKSDFDKYYHAQLSEGVPDTAANRMRAHLAWDAATKNAGGGAFLPFYNTEGQITGAWDPKGGRVAKVPDALAGYTTAAGQGIANKADTKFEKQKKDYQGILNHVSMADQAASTPNGPGDYTILMSFVDATKPSTGFRFTEAERQQILAAQSLANRVEANYDQMTTGAFLSNEQRQQMLTILHNAGNQAQQQLQHLNEGRVHSSPGAEGPNGAPKGKTAVYDTQGVRHFVNSNTLGEFLKEEKYKGWSVNAPAGAGTVH